MKKEMLYASLTVLGLLMAWITWPPFYMAHSIEGRVVDADTGQPLEGVIITANWQLQGGMASIPVGQIKIMETVTDVSGHFQFPAWGPKLRPLCGRLDYEDPQMLFFKEGYEFIQLHNEIGSRRSNIPVRRSIWNKKVIGMKKFQGSLKEYAQHLGDLTSSLEWAYLGNQCEWKEISRMVVTVHKYALYLKKQGISPDLYTFDKLIPYKDRPDICGAGEYLRNNTYGT